MVKDPNLAAQIQTFEKSRQAMVKILNDIKERKKILERQRGNRSGMSDQEIKKLDSDIRLTAREYEKKANDLRIMERSIRDLKRLVK